MSDELFQIIYISAAAESFDEADLPELLNVARKNNTNLNITGMLLYHDRSFIQVLTGPEESVINVYNKVERDARHTNARILYRGPVEHRTFEDWSMGFYKTKGMGDELPGLNNVLSLGFNHNDETDGDRARQVLEGFREGKWRQAVDA